MPNDSFLPSSLLLIDDRFTKTHIALYKFRESLEFFDDAIARSLSTGNVPKSAEYSVYFIPKN